MKQFRKPKGAPVVRCKAKTAAGVPCKNPAILGGLVCRNHGGSAPQVKRAAQERLADLIDPDRALREMARIAYSDIRTALDPTTGRILPVSEWSDELAASVSSVEVLKRNVTAGDGQMDDVLKVRLWDKPRMLEAIGKNLGILKERMEHTGANGGPIETRGVSDDALLARMEGIIAEARARTSRG